MSFPVPFGFQLAGVSAGIKKVAVEDVTLVVCPLPAVAAGVYTQNLVYAAPVAVDRERTPSDRIRVVVVNSGNANACTGERGLQDAREMARLAAAAVGASPEESLVMSTGIIGEFLPMPKIAAGITAAAKKLARDDAALLAAARGITTTDKGPKLAGRKFSLSGRDVCITGFCKGAGMIGPKMATMLGVLMTDAALSPAEAQTALAAAVEDSFNCISVEGHMSTNDTVVLLASGEATPQRLSGDDLRRFREQLTEVCIELAKQIPDDGEGATHLITIDVRGCGTREDAVTIAKAVANSALVKTAILGGDPNWGRIVSAAGYCGVKFDAQQVDLRINGFLLYEAGQPVAFDAKQVSNSMAGERETRVELRVGCGPASVRFWTSDLTPEYVRFNSSYRT